MEGSPGRGNSLCKGPVVRHVYVMCWDGSEGFSGWTAGAEAGKVGRVQVMLLVRSGGACLKICSGLPGCFSAPGQQGGGWETAVLLTVCPLPQFCDTDSPVSDPVVFSLMAKLGASSLLISCCLLPLSQLVTIQIPRRQSDWSSTAFEVKMSFMVCLLIGCPCQVSSNQLWLPLNGGPGWDNFPT